MVTKKKGEESFQSQSRNGVSTQESRPSWVLPCSLNHPRSNSPSRTLLTLTQQEVSSTLKVVPIDAPLINQITGLPLQGHEINSKEEARRVERDVIIQRLYQGYEGIEVWSRSNGFIINRMTHEGAKWAARILARRLICSEASTYLSHQWVAIALKVAGGITYAWALCGSDLHGGIGCSHLGQSYLFAKIELVLEILDRRNKLPEYIKKQWKEVNWTEDDQNTYVSLIDAGISREQAEEAEGRREHDQGISKSPSTSTGVVATMPHVIQPLTSLPPTLSQPLVHDIPLSHWGQSLSRTKQTQELPEDWVPSPALKRIREKRKGRIEELELELILQADQAQKERAQLSDKISVLTSEIDKLDIQPSKDSFVKEVELSEFKMNNAMLQLRCGLLEGQLEGKEEALENLQEEIEQKDQSIASNKEIESLPKVAQSMEAELSELAATHMQLATKRILLDEGYQEMAKGIHEKRDHFPKVDEVNPTDTTRPKPSKGQASPVLLPSSQTPVLDSSRGEITSPKIDIERVETTNVAPYPEAFVSSYLMREIVPGSFGREDTLGPSQIATPLLDPTLIEFRVALTLRQEPIEAVAPRPILLVQCNSPIGGTERAELEKESPQIVIGEVATFSSIPRAYCSKRRILPPWEVLLGRVSKSERK
eukprot:Gb_32257 [translate_table: standard]